MTKHIKWIIFLLEVFLNLSKYVCKIINFVVGNVYVHFIFVMVTISYGFLHLSLQLASQGERNEMENTAKHGVS